MSEPQRFFFVHMQKTAGTVLMLRLREYFGDRAVYPLPEEQDRVAEGRVDATLNPNYLAERFEARRDQVRVVTGHFPLCVTEILGVPFSTFTVLREPVERTLSFLRHHKQRVPGSRAMSLEEIYDDVVLFNGLIHNHMVKMLSLTSAEMTDWAMTRVTFDDDRLERAKENLINRIDVFGVQERFEDFCQRLAARFEWDLGERRIANWTEPVEVSEEFRARIERDNHMDVELYRFAREALGVRDRNKKRSPS